jgi:hypothetical protein
MMRRLVNILAVIIGLVSAWIGAAGAFLAGGMVVAAFKKTPHFPEAWPGLIIVGIGAGYAFLGILIASRALLHLRHPDAGTARDMIGTAIYLIVFLGVVQLVKSAWVFPLIMGLYIFHRFLVKRLAARAFPAGVTSANVGP